MSPYPSLNKAARRPGNSLKPERPREPATAPGVVMATGRGVRGRLPNLAASHKKNQHRCSFQKDLAIALIGPVGSLRVAAAEYAPDLRHTRPSSLFTMRTLTTLLRLLCLLATVSAPAQIIVCPPGAPANVQLAAKGIPRYVYLRTGKVLPIAEAGQGIALEIDPALAAQKRSVNSPRNPPRLPTLSQRGFVVHAISRASRARDLTSSTQPIAPSVQNGGGRAV